MRAYSMDIRERVIENLDHESMRKTAKRFGVSDYFVYRLKQRYREAGTLAPKPTGPGKRISTVGALGLGGLTSAMCFEGTLTGEVFLQFLDEFLVPGLKPGQIVILDNAKAHKVEGVRERIEEAGARVLYLPPYSPDLNPIEMACSKVNQFLRKAQARTVEALYEAIAQALQTLSPSDAKGFFKHVGFCI